MVFFCFYLHLTLNRSCRKSSFPLWFLSPSDYKCNFFLLKGKMIHLQVENESLLQVLSVFRGDSGEFPNSVRIQRFCLLQILGWLKTLNTLRNIASWLFQWFFCGVLKDWSQHICSHSLILLGSPSFLSYTSGGCMKSWMKWGGGRRKQELPWEQLDLLIGEKLSCARIILALLILTGSPATSYLNIGVWNI